MRDLTVTLIQTELFWQDPAGNRDMLGGKIGAAADCDLIVLPEMFTTGYTMEPATCAEPMDGPTMSWLAEHAERHDVAITGSFACSDAGGYYNRLVWMRPDGNYQIYDKRHLLRLSGEHQSYIPGRQRVIAEVAGWRVCPLICYDLRFPVWSRCRDDYDLLIYVANWPKPRHHNWRPLLTARAIENMAYTIGVNRVGVDGNQQEYLGGSCVIDMGGRLLEGLPVQNADGSEDEADEDIITATLDADALADYRARLAFNLDADSFELTGV